MASRLLSRASLQLRPLGAQGLQGSRGLSRAALQRATRRYMSEAPEGAAEGAAEGAELSQFPGAQSHFSTTMKTRRTHEPAECYRVMDNMGAIIEPESAPAALDSDEIVQMYKTMTKLNVMDGIFYDAQRQGRISFYMTCTGEEAIHIGTAAALKADDELFCQYREAGLLMHRGFSLDDFSNQCFSTDLDLGKGRQMPIHYGSRKLHYQTISSPLTTQLPQAVGAAYAFKRDQEDRAAVCFFGEGAASEGDFHAGMNFAATLDCPVLFICRNNGYAISTASTEQYKGDGIAARGPAYGIETVRVDGGDMLAVHEAVKQCRVKCVQESRPILIEMMAYRGSHHSTSDDSTRYRSKDEISWWHEHMNPLARTRLHLEARGLWDSDQEASLRASLRAETLRAIAQAETRPRPPLNQLFVDVYKNMPPHLVEQQQDMLAHLDKYPGQYGLDAFADNDTYKNPAWR